MTWLRIDPAQFWGSDAVEAMDIEAAGLLWWLVCRSWDQGGIKDDPAHYRKILRGRCSNFEAIWPEVRAALTPVHGELRCDWLEEERVKVGALLKKDADRKRLERLSKPPPPVVGKKVRPKESEKCPKDVPSSTPPREGGREGRTDGGTEVGREGIFPPSAAAVVVPVSRPIPSTPHHQFIAFWMEAFLAVQGRPYGFDDKKDGAQVKAILKLAGGSLALAKERAHILLHAAPEWIDDGGRDLGTLRSQWNKLVSMGTGRTSGAKQSLITENLTGVQAGIGLFAHRKPKELKP